jgi:hypothetical protein
VVLVIAALTLVPWTIRNARVLGHFVPVSTESGFALEGTYNSLAQHRTDYPALWAPPFSELAQLVDHRDLNEAQIESGLDSMAFRFLSAHPAYLLKVAFWNTVRLFNLSGTGLETSSARYEAYPPRLAAWSVYAFWLLAALSIAGLITSAARRAPLAFWLCPVVMMLSTVMILGMTRYRVPADPFILMLAALGLQSAWRRFGERGPVPSPAG